MNKEALIDAIQSSVANYCYDYGDNNFVVVVKITADDGWVKAEIKEELLRRGRQSK